MTNSTVMDDTIRFIAINTNANPNKKNENKRSDDNEDKDEGLTTNQMF